MGLHTRTTAATAGLRAYGEEFGHHGGCRAPGDVDEIVFVPSGRDALVAWPDPVHRCVVDGF